MRPSAVAWIIIGAFIGLDVLAVSLFVLTQADGGKPWHYWFSAIFAIQAAFLLVALVVGYYWRVGRLEMRSRLPQ